MSLPSSPIGKSTKKRGWCARVRKAVSPLGANVSEGILELVNRWCRLVKKQNLARNQHLWGNMYCGAKGIVTSFGSFRLHLRHVYGVAVRVGRRGFYFNISPVLDFSSVVLTRMVRLDLV